MQRHIPTVSWKKESRRNYFIIAMVRSKMEKEKDQVPPLLVLERGTTSNSAARSSSCTSSSDSSDDENCNLKRDDLKGEEIKKPRINAIVMGRGGGSSNYQGNMNFRKLVNR